MLLSRHASAGNTPAAATATAARTAAHISSLHATSPQSDCTLSICSHAFLGTDLAHTKTADALPYERTQSSDPPVVP